MNLEKNYIPRVVLAMILGLLGYWIIDSVFHLTDGAFHHLFGGGILWTYLLVPALVAFYVGFIVGKWGKYWGAVPPMAYILWAYMNASRSGSFHTVGLPTAPFMMIFFITVPEVSFVGGWAGEYLRKRQDKIKRLRLKQKSNTQTFENGRNEGSTPL